MSDSRKKVSKSKKNTSPAVKSVKKGVDKKSIGKPVTKKFDKSKRVEISIPSKKKTIQKKVISKQEKTMTVKLKMSRPLNKVGKVGNATRKPKSSEVITQIEDFVYRAQMGERSEVYLVGTAHVSKKSVELVKQTLDRYQPDMVYLELDADRKKSLTRKDYRDMDIFKMIKSNKILFFIFYLIVGVVQKKIAEKYSTRPGGEFIAALEWANANNRKVVLVDRNAQITVKRAWRSMSLREQLRFIFSGFLSMDEEAEFDVESIKEDDLLSDMIKKLGVRFPNIKRIVIDERDAFMCHGIVEHIQEVEATPKKKSTTQSGSGSRRANHKFTGLAVVGAGHLEGMKRIIKSPPRDWHVNSYLVVPPPHRFWEVMPWFFTGAIAVVFLAGFWYSDWATIGEAFLAWGVITGGLSAVGTILAGGHPLTVLTAFISAPITTLHPVLGVGLFTAIAQFYFSPPRVKDFDTLTLRLGEFTFWWRNRITRIFLVFFFSSLGAGIGMWLALSKVIDIFT